MATPRICQIEDCGKVHYGRGWCSKHYKRWWTHGDPLAGRTFEGEPLRYLLDVALPYSGHECLIWPFARNEHGYAVMKSDASAIVSRRVCEMVNGPPPTPQHTAAHSCGKGHEGCVTPQHLRWATYQENMADTVAHGTRIRGERCHFTKLTADDVRRIRALRGTMLQREIAAQFGVASPLISRIHSGLIWKWLD